MNPDEIDARGLMPLETPILKVSRPVAACRYVYTVTSTCGPR